MDNLFLGKKILVTGGTGSIGSEIVRQILRCKPNVVRIFSRDETKQFFMREELSSYSNVRFLIGDIRDRDRLATALEDIDMVFHAAALKHVPSCEYNPYEAVETNIRGTQNLISQTIKEGVEKFVAISTDKAVNPVNVMGATKLLVERLVTSAQFSKGKHPTTFACVRFGNVLGSRGSVTTLFKKQIEHGGPVTVTCNEMTRFFMLIPQAVGLVFEAMNLMQGGDLFILKMPSAKLQDFVQAAIMEIAPIYGYSFSDIEVQEIGIRAGEKMHEELMTREESARAQETNNMFIVTPPIMNPYAPYQDYSYVGARSASVHAYLSQEQSLMTLDEIRYVIRSAISEQNFI
jgi:FlaA1/EpsC-like NDP-sugar epimerase